MADGTLLRTPLQALLANISAMYAVYHGPEGLRKIAEKVHGLARVTAAALTRLGHKVVNDTYFDNLTIRLSGTAASVLHENAIQKEINLRRVDEHHVAITFDESHSLEDVVDLLNVFVSIQTGRNKLRHVEPYTPESLIQFAESIGVHGPGALKSTPSSSPELPPIESPVIPGHLARTTPYLTQSVFRSHHTETDILRYVSLDRMWKSLSVRQDTAADASVVYTLGTCTTCRTRISRLCTHQCTSTPVSGLQVATLSPGTDRSRFSSPLGSCTMKLNSTTSMTPFTWDEYARMHPFVPAYQAQGYKELTDVRDEISPILYCRMSG